MIMSMTRRQTTDIRGHRARALAPVAAVTVLAVVLLGYGAGNSGAVSITPTTPPTAVVDGGGLDLSSASPGAVAPAPVIDEGRVEDLPLFAHDPVSGRSWFLRPEIEVDGCAPSSGRYTVVIDNGHELDLGEPVSRFVVQPGGTRALTVRACGVYLEGLQVVTLDAAGDVIEAVDVAIPSNDEPSGYGDVGWLADGRAFYAGSGFPGADGDGYGVWAIEPTSGIVTTLGPLQRRIEQLRALPDGRFAETTSNTGIRIGQLDQLADDPDLQIGDGARFDVSPDGRSLALYVFDDDERGGIDAVEVIDLATLQRARLDEFDGTLSSVSAGPDGLIAWVGEGGALRVGRVGHEPTTIAPWPAAEGCVALAPAGWVGNRLHVLGIACGAATGPVARSFAVELP